MSETYSPSCTFMKRNNRGLYRPPSSYTPGTTSDSKFVDLSQIHAADDSCPLSVAQGQRSGGETRTKIARGWIYGGNGPPALFSRPNIPEVAERPPR